MTIYVVIISEMGPSIEEVEASYPTEIRSEQDQLVLVAQAYAYGKYLGHLQVEFDAEGQVTSYGGKPILLNNSIAQGNTAKMHHNKRSACCTSQMCQKKI